MWRRAGGYGVVAALEPARDVQPAAGGPGHDLVDQGQIGSAGPCPIELGPAEQLHQALQVLAALPGRLGDGGESLLGPGLVTADETLSRGGLDDHDADGVADDVVQLTGDAGPFVPQRDLREQLALLLELAAAAGELIHGLAALPQHRAGQEAGHAEHHDGHRAGRRQHEPEEVQVDPQAEPGQPRRPAGPGQRDRRGQSDHDGQGRLGKPDFLLSTATRNHSAPPTRATSRGWVRHHINDSPLASSAAMATLPARVAGQPCSATGRAFSRSTRTAIPACSSRPGRRPLQPQHSHRPDVIRARVAGPPHQPVPGQSSRRACRRAGGPVPWPGR